jgi:DNA topoisomerase III
MKVVLAEKKQQAEKLATPFQTKDGKGYIEVLPNPLFPKGGYITWAMGHLFSLANPGDYDPKYKNWILEDLPILPETFKYILDKSKAKQYKIVKDLLNDSKVTEIIIGTDPGREGEAIGRIIVQMCGVKKSMKRLWTSSLTVNAVQKAFHQLLPEAAKRPLYYEAQARAFADWLVGINSSRAFSLRLQERGLQGNFSCGRVQSPLLALIIDRELKIEAFQPKPFWEVFADFEFNGNMIQGKWSKDGIDRLDNHEQATALAEYCQGMPAKVEEIQTERKKFPPPLLFNLSALQTAANRRYQLAPDHVLEVCESLYLKEYISYPRTDSSYVTEEEALLFPDIIHKLGQLEPYRSLIPTPIKSLVTNRRFVNPDKVSDHYAIIPTEQIPVLDNLPKEERQIYDLIAKSLIAAHYDDSIVDYTRIITLVDNKFSFVTNGKQVIAEGWRKVTDSHDEENNEDDIQLPAHHVKEPGITKETTVKDGMTVPPKRYTEGDLINLMKTAGKTLEDSDLEKILNETQGIGTESTRASIITTLKKREYITITKNMVYSTAKGRMLIQAMGECVLTSAALTGKWEQKLHQIGEGKVAHEPFIAQAKLLAKKIVEDSFESVQKASLQVAADNKGQLIGCTFKQVHPHPNTSLAQDEVKDKAESKAMLQTPSTPVLNGDRKGHNQLQSNGILKGNLGPCKLCGEPVLDKGKFYGCSAYIKTGCGFTLSKKILNVDIQPDHITALLNNGESGLIEGFTKTNQKPFNAALIWENGKLGFKTPSANVLTLPLQLLDLPVHHSVSERDDRQAFTAIEREATDLKRPVRVVNVTHGPRVSRYELLPEKGINIKAYDRFKANFQAALRASKISLYIPIPGTNRIGIEVPNAHPFPVQLRQLLENDKFLVSKKSLSFPLGMNLQGEPVFADLAEMPHLLVAGATGAGKSVFLNSLIISLLFGTTPKDLKLMFIDPKQVELSVYKNLPHLFCPIVTEVNKTGKALEYLVREMMNRYHQFNKHGVRNITAYNEKYPNNKIPFIVLIIDELADLLMTTEANVESLIQRLAQLARAAGIHMVIATQRPTKKVLSPTIKSNLPVRVAFAVASTADSMTILDEPGAESLLGKGDMLFLPKDGGKYRLQSPFLADQEIERVVQFIVEDSHLTSK